MFKIKHRKVKYNKETDNINVSFRMSKKTYDGIKTSGMVEDLGLAVLAGIQKEVGSDIPLDSPDLKKVKVTEKYED